jgi:3-hydroxyisobutyrate dehydrogenase
MRLALIGSGRMGTPIAARLRAAGHRVVVHDALPATLERLAAEGFEVAADAVAAVRGAEVVLLCLPDAGAVVSVAGRLPEVPLLVDLTSSLPSVTRGLGRRMVDAPVSGGVSGAAAGTLTAMVGGEADLVAEARPVLAAFASQVFHAGGLGAGHAAKALNNALSAVALSATSEAVAAGRSAAHRPEGTIRRLNHGLGRTQNSEVKFPRDILPGTYASGFTAGLMVKDVGIALQVAAEREQPAPLVAAVREEWRLVVHELGPDADFTRVYAVVAGWGSAHHGTARCDLDHFDRAVAAACLLGAGEMVAVAEAEGLDRDRFLEIVNAGSGRSEATRHFADGLGFAPRQAARSLDAVRRVAAAGEQAVPVLAVAAELWKQCSGGWAGGRDPAEAGLPGPPKGGVPPR